MKAFRRQRVLFALVSTILGVGLSCSRRALVPDIVIVGEASWHERAAAKELRRYFYLRTGEIASLREVSTLPKSLRDAVVIGQKGAVWLEGLGDVDAVRKASALGDQDYLLKTVARPSGQFLLVAGGSGPAVLYGAYDLVSKLGVRFYLDGDVVPDAKAASFHLDLDEIGHPLFPVRGIQPFHDFAEGPDWWTRENYKAVLGQLPKLRMNFFGLHTYPDNPSKEKGATPNAEPTVWIGQPGDSAPDGKVAWSYPASYQNTARGNWGYEAKKTSDFHFGASLLFDQDDFGNDVMEGFCPEPAKPEAANQVFSRAADVFQDSFRLARKLGVKTCVGTETPLTVPTALQARLKATGQNPANPAVVKELYKGLFSRIAKAYPIDYYWFWTNEGWTWDDAPPEAIKAVTTDLAVAVEAWKEIAPPFNLATCGWVLGPPSNRTLFDQVLPKGVAMSCINREVGKTPVDPGFSRITGRSLWAIPWLEDDPSLTSPQLWVGRMRRDAVDALRYGCDGLLGIHWRTRILSANISALAHAAWDQSWNNLPRTLAEEVGPITGQHVSFPEQKIAGVPAQDETIYRDVRDRVFAYYIPVPNGTYAVTLKFVEGQVGAKRGRVFDVLIQGKKVLENLDIFARVGKFRALDFTFRNVEVADGRLAIQFADRIQYPAIAGIVIEGKNFAKKINCGGPAAGGYEADWPETPRFMPSLDFYRDWAGNQFGPAAAEEIAAIFARLDGVHPIPVTWIGGPGNIQPDARPWQEVRKAYSFVDEMKALASRIVGKGCQERFYYWLQEFVYMKEVARFNCLWAQYNQAMEKVRAEKDGLKRTKLAKDLALPIRSEMAVALRWIFKALLATASTTGELGTIANWEQHLLPGAWERPEDELRKILDSDLPNEVILPKSYFGAPRVIVPALRTSLEPKEALNLKVIVLAKEEPVSAVFYWREMGKGEFQESPLPKVGRSTYRVILPARDADIEYYIKVKADGREAYFPATAPEMNQTVVVF